MPKLFDKLTDGLAAFRGEDKSGRENPLGLATPATESKAMEFGSSGSIGGYASLISQDITRAVTVAISRYAGTDIDWKREAGDLTLSSLVGGYRTWASNSLSAPVFQVVEVDERGVSKPIPNHPAAVLWNKPNDFYEETTLLDGYVISDIISGNTYIVKVLNAMGEPIELWYVPHWMMWPRWPAGRADVFITDYAYNLGSMLMSYPLNEVIHLRNQPNLADMGRTGTSPLDAVMREICGDEQWANFGALMARNMGVPPTLLSPKEGTATMGEPERAALKEEYQRRTSGDERGKALVASMGIEVEHLSFDPKELDIRVARRINEERFASCVGVHPAVMFLGAGLDKMTYNNISTAERAAWDRTLIPKIQKIERVLTKQYLADFFPNRQLPPNVRVKFNLDNVRPLQEDRDATEKRERDNLLAGGMMLSEFQQAIGRTPDKNTEFYYLPRGVQIMTGEAAMKRAQKGPFAATDTETDLIGGDIPGSYPIEPEPEPKPNGKAA